MSATSRHVKIHGPDHHDAAAAIKNHLAFYPDRVDGITEEP